MTSKIILFRHLRLTFAFLLFLAPGIINATTHSISGSNFTMLEPKNKGALVGGATDVFGNFDDTKICTSTACTDFALTLASNQPFLGVQWFAHDIRVFSEGTYVFDTDCTGADIAAGITDCGDGTLPRPYRRSRTTGRPYAV